MKEIDKGTLTTDRVVQILLKAFPNLESLDLSEQKIASLSQLNLFGQDKNAH
ncbi:hypothetical protein [Candidatus Protochlamydia phocaeensis]|uniref:hypothetical protein n=1 Tax=Candidatus Protochlamydia phocaeensis TaxID=1414722 RepID=UPI000A8489AD|nr:hypothetical protein [Candidatus Protochlamydia phocaeensis]